MPYTKEEARLKIQKLVDDFRAHEATLEHAPEAQIENNFIRPLFRYLNWMDVYDCQIHAVAAREQIDRLVYELPHGD